MQNEILRDSVLEGQSSRSLLELPFWTIWGWGREGLGILGNFPVPVQDLTSYSCSPTLISCKSDEISLLCRVIFEI